MGQSPLRLPSPVSDFVGRRRHPGPNLKTFCRARRLRRVSHHTELTAQNTNGVTGIHQLPADFVTAQIDAVFGDLDVRLSRSGWWRSLRRSTPSLSGP